MTKTQQFRPMTETLLTLGATLVMGMIDAETFLDHGAVFVSAQTGNMVVFAVKLIEHGWSAAWVNVPVWIGYFMGAFIAQGLSEHYTQDQGPKRLLSLMAIDVVVYVVLSSTQHVLPSMWLIFFLGIVAGYELTIFRQVGGIAINNGIMTGNSKNLATASYQAWIKHDKVAQKKQGRIALVVVTFLLGCGFGAELAYMTTTGVLWIVSGIKALLLGMLFLPNAMEDPTV